MDISSLVLVLVAATGPTGPAEARPMPRWERADQAELGPDRARRGLEVTLADLSGVALELARREAARAGLTLRTLAIDLESEPLPPSPWSLILCVDFLWRPLFESISAALAPGGLLVVVHLTRSNLQRHTRPSPRHLLEDGELSGLVRGLEIVRYEEGLDRAGPA
jgi:SAM-dependent methyltransferase